MIRLLQRQGFIEHKPTSASEAAHQQRLLPVGYQFKLVSLQALHDGSLYCVLHHDAIGHVYPGPEVTINVPAARKRSFLILRTRFARGGEFARFSGLEEDKAAKKETPRSLFHGGPLSASMNSALGISMWMASNKGAGGTPNSSHAFRILTGACSSVSKYRSSASGNQPLSR